MSTTLQTTRPSLADSFLNLPKETRLKRLNSLTQQDIARLKYAWRFWARDSQIAPAGEWECWMIMAGRGFGKTRSGAEWVRENVETGQYKRVALVGGTAADCRDVMVEGESGIMAISPTWFMPSYEPSKRRLTWPNGAIATTYSADKPDRLRGPQHDLAWCDEPGTWRYPEAMDMLLFGLRLGENPRRMVTGTPKPVQVIRDILQAEGKTAVVTRGASYENRANLAPGFFNQIISRYEGTRLGRQEIYGELLDDFPGALWLRSKIDETRTAKPHFDLLRIVVAIDPATTATEESDETGIVVMARGSDDHGYLLEDLSFRGHPQEWGQRAVEAYHKWHADRVVAEVNNGGEMVEHVIRTIDPLVSYKAVHATRGTGGKVTRAEPCAALMEQGKVHHVGSFTQLEDQLCAFTPEGYGLQGSPDRADAYVWALTELLLDSPMGAWGQEYGMGESQAQGDW